MSKKYRSIILVYHDAKWYIRLCTEKLSYTGKQYWINFTNPDHNSVMVLNPFVMELMHRTNREYSPVELYDIAYVVFYCSASKNGIRKLLRYLSAREIEVPNIKVLPILSRMFR